MRSIALCWWIALLSVSVAVAQSDPSTTQVDPQFSKTLPGEPRPKPTGPPRRVTPEELQRAFDRSRKASNEVGDVIENLQKYSGRNQPDHPFYQPGAPPPDPLVKKALLDELKQAGNTSSKATNEYYELQRLWRQQPKQKGSGLQGGSKTPPLRPKGGIPPEEFWPFPWKPKC